MQKLNNEQVATALLSPLGFASVMLDNWKPSPHFDIINHYLERVIIGECKRLIINIPPRGSKTELAVKCFIAWTLGYFPHSEFIHTSYSKTLAENNTYATRNYMLGEKYNQIFPHIRLKHDRQARDEFHTMAGGVVYAVGAGGAITGYGAGKAGYEFGGAVIIDDPLKADDAYSDAMRNGCNEWFLSTITSRLNSPDTPIIVIMQRLHENDLSGFLLGGGSGEEWEHCCIPAIDEDGNSFCEWRYPLERLNAIKLSSSMIFAGQYMQAPAPAEGGLYKTVWFKERHDYVAPFNGFERVMLSVDGAFTSKQKNDASAITAWGIKENKAYLLDCHNVRMDYPELEALIKQLYAGHKASGVLVEIKASGLVLAPALRVAGLNVIEINPVNDKITRVVQSSTPCEAGRIILPKHASWLHETEQQLLVFPNAKHDDIVDSVSQFINWWQGGTQWNENTYRELYGY